VLGGLLLRLAENVDVPARLVGRVGGVVTFPVFAQSADLLHLLGEELNLLEVVTDTRWSDRLGDHAVATNLGPGKATILSDDVTDGMQWGVDIHDVSRRDLGPGTLGDSLGDLLDLGAGNKERDVKHVVAEGLITLASGFLR